MRLENVVLGGPVRLAYGDQLPQAAQNGSVLASIVHGGMSGTERPWPVIASGLAPASGIAAVETFFTDVPPERDTVDGVVISANAEVAFAAFDALAAGDPAAVTRDRYGMLLSALRTRGFRHVLRMWNVIPHINAKQGGLERYRSFSVGRAAAFEESGLFVAKSYPAATAVGSGNDRLVTYALAARRPGRAVENPQQVPAYEYPVVHGPRSPLFCRGLVAQWGSAATLLLSGTASIAGHESQHAGDLAAQVTRTLQNVDIVVREARMETEIPFRFGANAHVKAYVRRDQDVAPLQQMLGEKFGERTPVLILRADICRQELLLEIEAAIAAPAAAA